jgi:Tol biopolymer transport system component
VLRGPRRHGQNRTLRAKPGYYADPRLSPDGKRLALTVTDGRNHDVWVNDLQREAMTRLTFGAGIYADPIWSPDGRYLVFGALGKGLYLARADGAVPPQQLTQRKMFPIPFSFAPDGKRLAYHEEPGYGEIWTLPLEDQGGQLEARKPELYLKTLHGAATPAFSPDGRWLAYVSDESGKNEVYVRAFPPQASRERQWQISNSGGELQVWSRSRHELVYEADDQLMVVNYTANGDSFVPKKPRVWIAKLGGKQFDVAPDGKRVVVVTPVDTPASPKADHEVVILIKLLR